ncbi:MAG: glucose/galactose MFS transporter [Bacteroidetes bacterium GWF2_42_66]|nr:MAG: glucose/galactose MFS transporter [Bacteroidetes bacterium GWA2_42_15]OFY01048.1 MAG: glucose/galactose MFS transporter [Bacteroidetes bacterium GWE2_42_39]OFY41891.1 MAG: glucose/galactose MFS transporter [Bacteroidetes bacterium GWF2_42_66]HBL77931.1 glucose/galactose MFS transporter [Prolixibacteraceae bacterium]HCR90154.1 glucose/galactose MFS transporter [Prolixibacteraceae bacterium]
MENKTNQTAQKPQNSWATIISIAIIGLMFFIFGFTTWINAILIPYFKISCELNNVQSLLVAFAFYIAYLVMAIPAAHLLEKVGFKKGIMIGFWIMALGALIFVPAALTRTYGIFLIGLFSIGTGLAILQPAANTYITMIGSHERAAQRMSIMGVCNKTAGIIAPLLLAAAILRPTDTELFKQIPLMDEATRNAALDELIRRVIVPYSSMAVVLFGLGLMIRYSILPEIDTNKENAEVANANSGKTSIMQFPYLILGAVAIFLHVGSQVTGINTVIGYAQSLNLPLSEAKVFPSYILGVTMFGFLLGIALIPKFINHLKVLRICTTSAIVLTLLFFIVRGQVTFLGHTANLSIWFLVILGLSNSLMWSTIWPLALNGLGRFTKMGGSIMIMGLCGSAIVPLIYGYFADLFNTHTAYWVLLPCYIYLVYYAYYGYRVKNWSFKKTV